MAAEFKNSETKVNLMRAFAGESQARNRYTFAASMARKNNLYVVEAVFNFTAGQEKEHAEIFFDHLKELAGGTVEIEGGYPVERYDDPLTVLRGAQHNEYEEHDPVYSSFARKAEEEGFPQVAASFKQIAGIEKIHGDRFGQFADWLEQKKLFVSEVETGWMCLNCGYVTYAKQAPAICPVCKHDQGYFVRLEMAPFTKLEK